MIAANERAPELAPGALAAIRSAKWARDATSPVAAEVPNWEIAEIIPLWLVLNMREFAYTQKSCWACKLPCSFL
jgi:hypothetical protein